MAQTSRTVEAYVHYRRRSEPLLVAAIRQVGRVINQSSSLSSCRACAPGRISSTITDATVMALRHDLGSFGLELLVRPVTVVDRR